ncbi:hypothetical protein [Solidesulfovibrio fructosivorans]|nr:hypothetical protein [Solidesulfovibrio fructosivorans]
MAATSTSRQGVAASGPREHPPRAASAVGRGALSSPASGEASTRNGVTADAFPLRAFGPARPTVPPSAAPAPPAQALRIHDMRQQGGARRMSLFDLPEPDSRQGLKLTLTVKQWRVFLDPDNWPRPRLAVLNLFEEYGRFVGRPACEVVPAAGQGWFGPGQEPWHRAMAAILAFARERTGFDYKYQEGMSYDTTAYYDEERPFLDFPEEPLFMSHQDFPEHLAHMRWDRTYSLPERFRKGAVA